MIEKVWDLNRISDQILKRAIERRRPLSCTLELTYRCNFRCRMCYIRMNDEQAAKYGQLRTTEEWIGMAKQLYDAGILNLTLTGGECTLYPGFEKLYEELSRMGFRITVMSNAGAYSESIRDVFRRYPPNSVGITLYGGSNETYEAVTGDPKGYDKVVENIRFFQSIRVPIGLNFTMIRQNVMDYPKIGRLCQELGIPYTLITDITGHRHDVSLSEAMECRLTPAERACVACHKPEEVGLAMEHARELEKELADFRIPVAEDWEREPEQQYCIGAHTGCAIYWNGEMQTCISLNGWQNKKPFETGFEAAWAQLKAEQEETFHRPTACRECGMSGDCIHNCAGRRFEGKGSPNEPDPYTCQYTYLLRLYRSWRQVTDSPNSPECV